MMARRTCNGICPFARLGKQRSKGVEDAGQWQLWVESEHSASARNGWKAATWLLVTGIGWKAAIALQGPRRVYPRPISLRTRGSFRVISHATKRLSKKVIRVTKIVSPPRAMRNSEVSPVPLPPVAKSRFRKEIDSPAQRIGPTRTRQDSARSTRAAPLANRISSARCMGRFTRYEYQATATPADRKLTGVPRFPSS
jgi:hypothetical protein